LLSRWEEREGAALLGRMCINSGNVKSEQELLSEELESFPGGRKEGIPRGMGWCRGTGEGGEGGRCKHKATSYLTNEAGAKDGELRE